MFAIIYNTSATLFHLYCTTLYMYTWNNLYMKEITLSLNLRYAIYPLYLNHLVLALTASFSDEFRRTLV